jgi:hypothetical protein
MFTNALFTTPQLVLSKSNLNPLLIMKYSHVLFLCAGAAIVSAVPLVKTQDDAALAMRG